jgi:hypothetical protein
MGCQSYLAFTTATKFGLDISQQTDQSPHIHLGYKRAELASIPSPPANATETNDTYSVLGTFCVRYDPNPFSTDSLQIRQLFATGMAARIAAKQEDLQKMFGQAAYDIRGKALPQDCFASSGDTGGGAK